MLRSPSARAPNSMRPCIQATILFSFNWATAVSITSSSVMHVAEAQPAILQHLLDFGGGICRAQADRVEPHAPLLPEGAVPGFERRPDGGAGVTGGGLHEDVLESRAVFQGEDQQGVEAQATRQAQVAALARHADGGRLDGLLNARRHVRAFRLGNGFAIFQAKAVVQPLTESAVLQAFGAEEGTVDARSGIREAQDLQEQFACSARRPRRRATGPCARPRWRGSPATRSRGRRGRRASPRGTARARGSSACRAPASGSRSGNRLRGRVSARWLRRRATDNRPTRHAPGGAPPRSGGCWGIGRAAPTWKSVSGNRAHDGDGVHLCRRHPGEFEAGEDGLRRHFAAAPLHAAADELGLLDGGDQFAILEDGAGGIAEDASDAQDDQRAAPLQSPRGRGPGAGGRGGKERLPYSRRGAGGRGPGARRRQRAAPL